MSANFLMRLDTRGIIEHTYFLHCHEAIKNLNSFHSLLDEASSILLTSALSSHKESEFREFSVNDQPFFVLIVPLGNQYLVFGSEEIPSEQVKGIYKNFLNSLIDLYDNPYQEGEDATKFYYESMQKLNNDLLNKTREVERLNNKLNRANRLLNSRLVKDPLTGLTSRYQYADEMTLMVKNHTDKLGIFCFIDIDEFKPINDTYGHKTGDLYLQEFARRLKKLPFKPSITMRIAGDEFGVFIGNLESVDDTVLKDIWNTCESMVFGPITVEDKELPLKFSLGMAIYNLHTTDIHELIDMADQAMYRAKETGNTYYVYNKEG